MVCLHTTSATVQLESALRPVLRWRKMKRSKLLCRFRGDHTRRLHLWDLESQNKFCVFSIFQFIECVFRTCAFIILYKCWFHQILGPASWANYLALSVGYGNVRDSDMKLRPQTESGSHLSLYASGLHARSLPDRVSYPSVPSRPSGALYHLWFSTLQNTQFIPGKYSC